MPSQATTARRLRHPGPKVHAVDLDGPGDVLQFLRAQILEYQVQLVRNLIAHHPADADAAGLSLAGQQPRI